MRYGTRQAGIGLRRVLLAAALLALTGCVAGRQAAEISDLRSQTPASQPSETLLQQASGQIATTIGKLIEEATAKFLELNAQLHAEVTGIKAEVGNQVAALSSRIDESTHTTTNQVWPWVIGGCLCFLGLVAAVVIVVLLKRSRHELKQCISDHSYAKQRPAYEAQRRKENGAQ